MRIEWKIENGEWKMNAMVSLALRAIHLVSRLRRVADMCSSRVSGIAYRLSNGRTLCAPCGRKNPLPFSIFEAVVGLWSAPDYLRKGVKIRGWKPWCLPSCAPAAKARTAAYCGTNFRQTQILQGCKEAITAPFAPPVHGSASPHQQTPDARQPEYHTPAA